MKLVGEIRMPSTWHFLLVRIQWKTWKVFTSNLGWIFYFLVKKQNVKMWNCGKIVSQVDGSQVSGWGSPPTQKKTTAMLKGGDTEEKCRNVPIWRTVPFEELLLEFIFILHFSLEIISVAEIPASPAPQKVSPLTSPWSMKWWYKHRSAFNCL